MQQVSRLERESARESASLAAAEWVASSRGEATAAAAAAVHHVEQDVGVDVDMGTAHTAHSTHSSHATHTTHAESTTSEHVGWVNQIISVVVRCTFPEYVSVVSFLNVQGTY